MVTSASSLALPYLPLPPLVMSRVMVIAITILAVHQPVLWPVMLYVPVRATEYDPRNRIFYGFTNSWSVLCSQLGPLSPTLQQETSFWTCSAPLNARAAGHGDT
jgi:hypothetical protein